MATDVRALLRAEQASRTTTQPRPKPVSAAQEPGRKRKATEDEMPLRKRARPHEVSIKPATASNVAPREAREEAEQQPPLGALEPSKVDKEVNYEAESKPRVSEPSQPEPDEAEWDAFNREMVEIRAETGRNTAASLATSTAVISAAPKTTAEIKAQKKEEQVSGRLKRKEEMEGDKEDAARALEDEFDEMEALEHRVKKLKEQRERLREAENGTAVSNEEDSGAKKKNERDVSRQAKDDGDEDDDERDSGTDDDAIWGFGRW